MLSQVKKFVSSESAETYADQAPFTSKNSLKQKYASEF